MDFLVVPTVPFRPSHAWRVFWPNGPWKGLDEVEFATLEWVDWFNNRRLLEPIGDIPPAEFEAMYYEGREGWAKEAGLN